MMKRLLLSLLAAPALIHAVPAQAQLDDNPVVAADIERLDKMMSQAFEMNSFTQGAQANALLLDMAAKARAGLATHGKDAAARTEYQEKLALALYYAAQYHNHEYEDAAGRALEMGWLIEALPMIEAVMNMPDRFTYPTYEYRGITIQLVEHGVILNDARLSQWSAANLKANRAALALFSEEPPTSPVTTFERNALAQALLRHGHITSSPALITEADALIAGLGGDLDYTTGIMRQNIRDGLAPWETF